MRPTLLSRTIRSARTVAHPIRTPINLAPRPQIRSISSSVPRSTVTDSLASIVQRMKDLVATERKGWVEGDKEREKGLRMLVFGKPGSGKGTLSARLVKLYDIAFVSTGDVLRKEIAAKSDLGKKAEEVVRTGGLVSDELMVKIVKTELDRLRGRSWIIDGFPRTLHQGKLLDDVLNEEGRPLNMIVHLNVPDSVIMARIAARWVHLPSGRVYNTTYSAPKVEGIDDVTGEALIKRPDDTPEVFTKRLKAYYDSTAPLLEYFSSAYPETLHSLTGKTSDEAKPSPPPSSSSSSSSSSSASASTLSKGNQSDEMLPLSTSLPPPSYNPSSHSDPASPNTSNQPQSQSQPDVHTVNANSLDQLWPQLQELVEPFGLKRRDDLQEGQVEGVRTKADDLKDPEEDEKRVK